MNKDFDLVIENLNLAKYFANRYKSEGISFDDLYSEAIIGLINATKVFDPSRGVFSAIASLRIKTQIFKFLAKNKYPISLSLEQFFSLNDSNYKENFVSKDNEEAGLEIRDDNSSKKSEKTNQEKQILVSHFNCLTSREKSVMIGLLGYGAKACSVEVLATKINLRPDTINAIKRSAIIKLTKSLNNNPKFKEHPNLSHEQIKNKICRN